METLWLYRARYGWTEGHHPGGTALANLEKSHPRILGKRVGFLPNMGHILLWDEEREEVISQHDASLQPKGLIYIALDDDGLYDGWYDAENVDNVFRMFREHVEKRGGVFRRELSGLHGLWIA
ncbi:MAG: hypothetical protein COT89_02425 [Candidatus Colwellbacteria bacterium CG10_big_fil_rev_8_21_14_0_10_42_22]|uniref:Uncharacterized protein n=1 Tax=Candidatus Colwellbacteria bacterium CG10_big_fil_rev_8_21_14_0_10_42_22 TaxID=1974540 RepID=A0A2H0VFR7_9BACT|nr:MAG: hypothetical protein COT89_02425 [Candidatus Colwellbacteria bacterium CG10_big_fil_rev_8_21_14_0_10_42_22]